MDDHGLASVEGGRHPAWGTANRIVPLGDAYLELIAVVNEATAARSAFGRWVAAAPQGQPFGWAVRTDDIDAVAARLGIEVVAGSRVSASGALLSWRLAGTDEAAAEPFLPFFIEWGEGTPLPGNVAQATTRIEELRLMGDAERLAAWLGPHELPVTIRAGMPTVIGLALSGGICLPWKRPADALP
ncbi:MAG TPA: VOC family protein [Thermoleophilaceae bacterium]|nr:VOC family protein [Thermoleophilaceae bacterium]